MSKKKGKKKGKEKKIKEKKPSEMKIIADEKPAQEKKVSDEEHKSHKKLKKKEYSISALGKFLIFTILILTILFVLMSVRETEQEIEEVKGSVGSGFIEVETSPNMAEIYIDGEYKDLSPATLYNIPIGMRNVIIRKEGYGDFTQDISIEAGKKTYIEADLAIVDVIREIPPVSAEIDDTAEIVAEEPLSENIKDGENIINVGQGFVLYYDFSENEFSATRQFEQDTFSKRYDDHFVFTRLNLVNIKVIRKNIDDVTEEDCTGIYGQFEFLNSGDSLCVQSKEGMLFAIGGEWEKTFKTNLKWKEFK